MLALSLGYKEKDLIFYTDEGVSGANTGLSKRPNYKKMLHDIIQGKVSKSWFLKPAELTRTFLTTSIF